MLIFRLPKLPAAAVHTEDPIRSEIVDCCPIRVTVIATLDRDVTSARLMLAKDR